MPILNYLKFLITTCKARLIKHTIPPKKGCLQGYYYDFDQGGRLCVIQQIDKKNYIIHGVYGQGNFQRILVCKDTHI